MHKTFTLDEEDLSILDQCLQQVVKVVDMKSAKRVCALHCKIENQLANQPPTTPDPNAATP